MKCVFVRLNIVKPWFCSYDLIFLFDFKRRKKRGLKLKKTIADSLKSGRNKIIPDQINVVKIKILFSVLIMYI